MSDLGCARHYNARPKIICPICNELTYSDIGICSTHGRFYDRAWRKSKKTKTESAGIYKVNTSPSDVVKILI